MACIAAALLDHTSASDGRSRTLPHSELVLVEDSAVQSASAFMREIVRRAERRSHACVVVAALRDPKIYGARESQTVDVHRAAAPFRAAALEDIETRISTSLAGAAGSARVTVLIDSLSALLAATGASSAAVYAALRRITHALPRTSVC